MLLYKVVNFIDTRSARDVTEYKYHRIARLHSAGYALMLITDQKMPFSDIFHISSKSFWLYSSSLNTARRIWDFLQNGPSLVITVHNGSRKSCLRYQ